MAYLQGILRIDVVLICSSQEENNSACLSQFFKPILTSPCKIRGGKIGENQQPLIIFYTFKV